jgi:DNA-binding PadR family transcriptional regulator
MTNNNGKLLNTDKRVFVSLCVLLADREQESDPITHQELSNHALVSLRTVPNSLDRLLEAELITIEGSRRGVSAVYTITEAGRERLEAYQ